MMMTLPAGMVYITTRKGERCGCFQVDGDEVHVLPRTSINRIEFVRVRDDAHATVTALEIISEGRRSISTMEGLIENAALAFASPAKGWLTVASRSDWPGVKASGFSGRAMHLARVVSVVHGGAMHVDACGAEATENTVDVKQVSCLRCYKTTAYREAATTALKGE